MKKILCMILAAVMLFSLCACGRQEPAQTTVVTEFTESTEPDVLPETAPETSAAPTPEIPDEVQLRRLAAYEKTLKTILDAGILPDGTQLEIADGFGKMEENTFAIADLNGDGEENLLFCFTTGPMAAMCAFVYGYDADTGELYELTSIFPAFTFYTGGLLKAEWSHNQGLAGDKLWPHAMMGYNPATRRYEVFAQVDAWDRERAEVDYNGNPYPAEVDEEGAGYVVLITTFSGDTYKEETLSKSTYEEKWLPAIFGSAEEIHLDEMTLTPENILAACVR